MNSSTFKWTLHGLGLATLVVVCGLAYVFVLRSMDAESRLLQSAIRQRVDFLAKSETIAARNRELNGKLMETERLLATLKRRIPETPNEADFLGQLAGAAKQAGVELVDYRPGTVTTLDRHSELTIQLAAKGNYVAMCRFFHRLDTLPRMCHITGVQIDARDSSSSIYQFDLTLQIFFSQKQPQVAMKAENNNG